MSKDLECPYCEYPQYVNHDDGFGYEEDVEHIMCCENCEKEFVFFTSIIFHYEPRKADCLNDGKHNYKKTLTYPKQFAKMKCEYCGDVRELTEDE